MAMLTLQLYSKMHVTLLKDQPNVFKDTKILKLTKPIPNDTISVRPDMNKDFQDKLKKHLKISLKQRRT